MTAAVGIFSSFQGVQGGDSPGVLDCLGLLLALVALPILSFCFLKARSFLNSSDKEKPDFTSMRSTGKTSVNAAPDDEDDTDQFGSVN